MVVVVVDARIHLFPVLLRAVSFVIVYLQRLLSYCCCRIVMRLACARTESALVASVQLREHVSVCVSRALMEIAFQRSFSWEQSAAYYSAQLNIFLLTVKSNTYILLYKYSCSLHYIFLAMPIAGVRAPWCINGLTQKCQSFAITRRERSVIRSVLNISSRCHTNDSALIDLRAA